MLNFCVKTMWRVHVLEHSINMKNHNDHDIIMRKMKCMSLTMIILIRKRKTTEPN